MTRRASAPPRVHIERLELDLRGIAPATADAAARALGPALARALATHGASIAGTQPERAERIDAGRVVSTASPGASDLAALIADRVAGRIRGDRT